MAADTDKNAQLNNTEPNAEDVQPLDADLPVDADVEETNAQIARGFDKKKIAGLGIVVGFVILAGIAVFSLSKKPTTTTASRRSSKARQKANNSHTKTNANS